MNMNTKTYTLIAFMAFFMLGSVFADEDPSDLHTTLTNIASQLRELIPAVSIMMIVLAGLVYGIGQVMGAEMRGKAAVWAQALLIGAILGLLIAALAEPLVELFGGKAIVTGDGTETAP